MLDPAPAPLSAVPGAAPVCDAACQAYCASLALDNPVDRGLCPRLWGLGLDTTPVVPYEACRRLFVDLAGYLPTRAQAEQGCVGRAFGQVAVELMARAEFVELNRRHWADLLRYNNQAVSVERIFDADELVSKLFRGTLAYDQFAAVVSAHPVLTRRHDTPEERAETAFKLFMGRPPYINERGDLARLYGLWDNGYYDHPVLQARLPDAFIRFRCLTDDGSPHPVSKGQCTSVLWGYHELILEPDLRADDEGRMWSGLLRPAEWERLQLPGRLLSAQPAFWEHAADEVLRRYLSYDLGTQVPAVREELVRYALQHKGDARAIHYAVVTSQAYQQSSTGSATGEQPWLRGPLKQIDVEPWIDSIKRTTGYALSRCDHRIPRPREFLGTGSVTGLALIEGSAWQVEAGGDVRSDYSDLARTLGGCPDHGVGGRFKTISILTTATQENFVERVCNPTLQSERGVPATALIPRGLDATSTLAPELAEQVLEHQVGLFFGRPPALEELTEARENAQACAPAPCTLEAFARPTCFALLSSSEMLFY